MELGRSAPMLRSASPGRAAAMVPAPVEGRGGTGSSATIAKFCSTDSGALVHLYFTTRAREALMMAGAGGATRARGWRATAIRFQQLR